MPDLAKQILTAVARKNYQPVKPKTLARQIGVPDADYRDFRNTLRDLVKQGRVQFGKNSTVRGVQPHNTVTGIFRRTASGNGFVRPHEIDGHAGLDVFIAEHDSRDASTGDEVLVRITRKPGRGHDNPAGEILEVLERVTRQFVGTYFERDGQALVRVDGTVFSHSIYVGDPGAKGARPDDKVVIEVMRFPTLDDRGEAVITEVLGARGQPGVDLLSVVRALGIPDTFPEEVLNEARSVVERFREGDLHGREDFTADTVITIDPVNARDFDDAVSLLIDSHTKHWQLAVHIADVGHFAPPGSALDREARRRGTSVYLPQLVIPMFPELISNGVASLQQGKFRYVKSALMDFTPTGQRTRARFVNAAIRVTKRFTYEQVSEILADPEGEAAKAVDPEILAMLLRMRDFALVLRKRRFRRGALELSMPEAVLEYDERGRVTGAHFAVHDISHQIIEEFMLAANEAVAEHLGRNEIPFLRRVHPAPQPEKLYAFADFARLLGYDIDGPTDRFELQRVLSESAEKPERPAIHYALLRSLKQAVYTPLQEEHYALAANFYCHFTSPIRRYPDLTVHRLIDRWLRTGRARSDETELLALGEHCSRTERRAETAEREVVKLRLLEYMKDRVGEAMEAIITGVADYGFYAQAERFPVEGLVHVSTLTDDYYYYDEASHTLEGKRSRKRLRLGDRVKVEVVRVDLQRRLLDFRLCGPTSEPKERRPAKEPVRRRGRGAQEGERERERNGEAVPARRRRKKG